MARNNKFDLKTIRQQFPALARLSPDGKPYIYTDAPGGTQVPQSVVDAMAGHLQNGTANASLSSAFCTGRETAELVHSARHSASLFLNCSPENIVFGANMTTLTFSFSRAVGKSWLPGSEILVTALDHDANIAPWIIAATENGCTVKIIPVDESGQISMEEFNRQISENTALVAFSLASNATGTITPAKAIIDKAREVRAMVYVDAVHFAAHQLIDVEALDCDFLVCSPYKFFGPHVGILYGKQEHLEMLQPCKVRAASELCPARWETGTQSFETLAGVDACIRYIASLSESGKFCRDAIIESMAWMHEHGQQLSRRFLAGIFDIPSIRLYGNPFHEQRTSTFAITMNHLLPDEIATQLGRQGIFSWAGNFYALELVKALGLEDNGGLLRLGFVHYHGEEDVDRILNVLETL